MIRLLKSPHHLTQLRQRLSELSHISPNSTPRMKEIGLFNTTQLVRDFLSGMYGMREAQDILAKKEKTDMKVDHRYPHLIVTRG